MHANYALRALQARCHRGDRQRRRVRRDDRVAGDDFFQRAEQVALGVQVLAIASMTRPQSPKFASGEASIRAATASACATGIRPFATM